MDEFLYILFLVGWLAFSIYQQSQKRKRKEAAKNLAIVREEEYEDEIQAQDNSTSHNAEPVEEVSSKTDFRKTLEEILLGEQISLETIPDEEAQSLEVIPEKEFVEKNKFQDYSRKLADTDIKDFESEMVFNEEDTNEESVQHYFNLRNAVVYAEILKPKYVN